MGVESNFGDTQFEAIIRLPCVLERLFRGRERERESRALLLRWYCIWAFKMGFRSPASGSPHAAVLISCDCMRLHRSTTIRGARISRLVWLNVSPEPARIRHQVAVRFTTQVSSTMFLHSHRPGVQISSLFSEPESFWFLVDHGYLFEGEILWRLYVSTTHFLSRSYSLVRPGWFSMMLAKCLIKFPFHSLDHSNPLKFLSSLIAVVYGICLR